MPDSVEGLQQRLQDIYELNVAEDVNDFLITDRWLSDMLGAAPSPPACRERLLLQEDADGLHVSLYLDAEVLDRLAADGRAGEGTVRDLHGFCLALEGVSHFVYLVWHATRERAVSLLEMELQAEIDKYVLIRDLLEDGGRAGGATGLIPRLFGSVNYHPELAPAEQRRYRAASRCAEHYCRKLESEYYGARSRKALLNELRRFYRLPGRDKVRATGAGGY